MEKRVLVIILGFLIFTGCVSPRTGMTSADETDREAVTAAQSVIGAVSGMDVDEKRLRELSREIQKDEETRSAVEALSNSMGAPATVKYCPVDGERYSSQIEKCPKHDELLKVVE